MPRIKKEEIVEKPEISNKKEIVKCQFLNEIVITEDSDLAREFYNQSRFGQVHNKRVEMALIESLYLLEKGKIEIFDGRNKKIDFDSFLKKAVKLEKDFYTRFKVFKDMRDRGYIVKTALKFGADFRVYDRGVKPGEDHAKWVLYPVLESKGTTWYDFAAKNRVAHSTKKKTFNWYC